MRPKFGSVATASRRVRAATLRILGTFLPYLDVVHHTLVQSHRHHTVFRSPYPVNITQHNVHHRAVLRRHHLEHALVALIYLNNILVPQQLGGQQVGHIRTCTHRRCIGKQKNADGIRTRDMEPFDLRLSGPLLVVWNARLQPVEKLYEARVELYQIEGVKPASYPMTAPHKVRIGVIYQRVTYRDIAVMFSHEVETGVVVIVGKIMKCSGHTEPEVSAMSGILHSPVLIQELAQKYLWGQKEQYNQLFFHKP